MRSSLRFPAFLAASLLLALPVLTGCEGAASSPLPVVPGSVATGSAAVDSDDPGQGGASSASPSWDTERPADVLTDSGLADVTYNALDGMDGWFHQPSSDMDARITTADEDGKVPRINTEALNGGGGRVTLNVTTPEKPPASEVPESPAVSTTVPLLDSVPCLINAVSSAPAAAGLKIVSGAASLDKLGVSSAIYDEKFFRSNCLAVADIAVEGNVTGGRVISLTDDGRALTLTVRMERSGSSGSSVRRFLIELDKSYASRTLRTSVHYADKTAVSAVCGVPLTVRTPTGTAAIPALGGSGAAVGSFNDSIERTVYQAVGDLFGGGAQTFSVTSETAYRADTGALAIALKITRGTVTELHPFYWSVSGGCALTADGYLAACGLSAASIAGDAAALSGVSAEDIADTCVLSDASSAYRLVRKDDQPLPLPIIVDESGARHVFLAENGVYNGVILQGVGASSGVPISVSSVETPVVLWNKAGTTAAVTVPGLLCVADGSGRLLAHTVPILPDGSPVLSLSPVSLTGDVSGYSLSLTAEAVGTDGSYTAQLVYDGTSLRYADDFTPPQPAAWTASANGSTVTLTNGTLTYAVPCAASGVVTVDVSPSGKYAAVTAATGSFAYDEVREGQPTLTASRTTHTVLVVSLADGGVPAMPSYTAASLAEAAIPEAVGCTHLDASFGAWTSGGFTVRYTLYDDSGSADTAHTVTASFVVDGATVTAAAFD